MGKKRLLLLLSMLLLACATLQAQDKTVTGKVTGDDGNPIFGATIAVKGTTIGTISGENGAYTIKVPERVANDSLVFSFLGYQDQVQSMAGRTTIDVVMQQADLQVEEVVVTALGISREKKALGYAVTDVDGEELSKSRGGLSNPVNALQGKVAGLQITSGAGSMGGSSKVIIRGNNSLSGSNQPLFVVDGVPIEGKDYNDLNTQRGGGGYDYGNLIQDINPDDIENISVLKGASASALYGSRAANGVIMITTKKGKKNQGLNVDFSSTFGLEIVTKLPKLQNEYGGGYGYVPLGDEEDDFIPVEINGKSYQAVDYATDESWGPKFDGRQVLSWYDLAKWEANGKQGNPTTSPWEKSHSDYRDFFEIGISQTTNVAITQSVANSNFRISYTNSTIDGYIPNSSLVKNVLNANGSISSLDKKFTVFTTVNYLNNRAKGRLESGYGDNNVMVKFTQWGQRQLNMDELEEYYVMPDGTQATWNRTSWNDPTPQYSNNPYWSCYKDYENDERNRVYGNIGVSYKILPFLKAQYKANLDFFSDKRYEHKAIGSQVQPKYLEANRQNYEINHEFMISYNQTFGDFGVSSFVGANIMKNRYELEYGETVGGLAIPDFYNLANSISAANAFNTRQEKGINSLFGDVTLSWKNMIYLEGTVRGDKSSALPVDNNVYVYPSVTASFLFSELIKDNTPWLTYGKARVNWAQVGNDTDPYNVYNVYRAYTKIDENTPGYRLDNTLNNSELKPESTTSWEAGLELSFFTNRLGLDFTYYITDTKNEILPLTVSGITGFFDKMINSGEIENKGIEVSLHGSPVKINSFEWNSTLTFASNKNKVKSLAEGVDYYRIQAAPFQVEVGAMVNEGYGVIMGTNYVYDSNGNKVVDENGLYLATDGAEVIGNIFPDFTGGWSNTFTYKNFDLSVLLDFSKGGQYYSTTILWGSYSGMLEETAANGVRENGIVSEGVTEDGQPNTTVVSARDYYENYYNGPAAQSILKSDYVKLREINFGYSFPMKKDAFIKALRLSAYGRNLAVWGPDVKHFDPEMIVTNSGNTQGIEGGATPMVANFGFTVNMKF